MKNFHCYPVPPDIQNFADVNFPPHIAQRVKNHWQQNKCLPASIYDEGSIFYPRRLHATLMFQAAQAAAGDKKIPASGSPGKTSTMETIT